MFSRPRWAPQKPTKKKKLQTQPKQVPKGNSDIFSVHVRNLYYAISDVSARSSAASAATASQLFPILVTQSLSTSPSSLQWVCCPALAAFVFIASTNTQAHTTTHHTHTDTVLSFLLVLVMRAWFAHAFGIDLTFTFLLVPSHSLCAATAAGAEAAANLSISSVLSTHPYCISQMRFPLPRDNENENHKLIKQKNSWKINT